MEFLFSIIFYFYFTTYVLAQNITHLGSFQMRRPGFTEIFEHENPSDDKERYSFVVSCFSPVPGTTDDVFFVRYPGQYLDNPSDTTFDIVGVDYTWPREPDHVPADVFGFNQVLGITDGFLTTGKNNGTIWLADLRDESNVINTDIVRMPSDTYIWFYHRVTWKDADGDGMVDVFTCRARSEGFPAEFFSEFIWLKNPGGDNPAHSPAWITTIISENDCDTFTREATLQAGGQIYNVIFTIGYFVNKFSLYWTNDPNGRWDDPSMIESRLLGEVTDDADCVVGEGYCGHFFDLVIEDLNNDGSVDILLSINSEVNGFLVAIEIPDDFRTDEFTWHDIADGFFPTSGLAGGGSPGQPQTFYPQEFNAGKPWLLLSGDDDGSTYYFTPNSQGSTDWGYSMIQFVDRGSGNIVGKPAAFDSNGDGNTEVFVPAWNGDEIMVFTFAPQFDRY